MNSVFITLRRFLKSATTENLGLKLVAAFIALLLYFLVMFQEESERNFDVEVNIKLPEETSGLVLSSELPEKLSVRLRGPLSTIRSVKSETILAEKVDLSQKREGTSHYYFSEEDFEIPTRTHFVKVTPESMLIKLERLVSRRLPVSVRTYGKLNPGMEMAGNPTISPSALSVIGPTSALRGISSIETEDIDIEGLEVGEHPFILPAKRIEGISIRRGDDIKVTLRVRWIPGHRMLSSLLLESRGTELQAVFKPKEVALGLSGPQVALDKLDPAKIVPVVVVPEEHGNRLVAFSADVTVEGLPDDVIVTSVAPAKVQVRLTHVGATKTKKGTKEQ